MLKCRTTVSTLRIFVYSCFSSFGENVLMLMATLIVMFRDEFSAVVPVVCRAGDGDAESRLRID